MDDDSKASLALDKLCDFVISGNLIELHNLMSNYKQIYNQHRETLIQGRQGFDPLYLAMHHSEEECAILLLYFGFPYNRVYDGSSVDLLATERNFHRFIMALELQRSGDVTQFKDLVESILSRSKQERKNCLHALAKQAIYENAVSDKEGNTLLHLCAAQQDLQALVTAYTLAVMGVNVNTQNKSGETALHIAASHGHIDMCRALLLCGVNPLLRDRLGQLATDRTSGENGEKVNAVINLYSPGLAEALRRGSYNAGTRALNLWVNPHSQLLPGNSALDFYRSRNGGGEQQQLMQQQSPRQQPECPPLAQALEREAPFLDLVHNILADNTDGVKMLLRKLTGRSLRLDRRHPETAMTPLSAAIRNRNMSLTRALIGAGAPLRNQRPYGEPLANYAISCTCPFDLLMELVESGVDSGARDPDGFTMLHRLIRTDIPPQHFAKILLGQKRQNVLLMKDRLPEVYKLRSPRDMAMRLGRKDLADVMDEIVNGLFKERSKLAKGLLMTLAANFYGTVNFGPVASGDTIKEQFLRQIQLVEKSCSELFQAIRNNDMEKMKALNEADYRDTCGYTALIKAVTCDRYEMALWILVERPQQAAIADNEGLTPLHYAYLLPDTVGHKYIQLLTGASPVPLMCANELEILADMRGFIPCNLRERRDQQMFQQALERARNLGVYGKS